MTETVGIAVLGASGRMGRMLVDTILATPGARISGATERPGHPWIGVDLGVALGRAALGVVVTDEPIESFAVSHAAVDFTAPAATVFHAELAAQARIVHVVGTTGLEREDMEKLAAASRHAAIVRAGNMSLGVNLLTVLARKVAQALGPDWDIEILEMHHRHKVDAPSGTALMLGEAAAAGRRANLADLGVRSRDGQTGPRPEGAIGFATLRGGDVVGEHEVIFAGPGERIVLRHMATDRAIFARGAVRAALWGQDREPGLYDMIDVLGLREPGAGTPDR
ncbi:4-hydroxy-tetrahydrodipicolinate reductase [Amaricoccus sp.]|uniref:4-hydroxy-tetrahydrodipicolinate reductase n=1 Tax=Amaricoccus sp. TaxID=1872485 RepID=UPI001B70C4A4|nr:4-hydroxy-tetrahydrodipicolinate reductase [Amaricoccus sp.]MBP7240878.1 4-hydroxy-tetrahydrodipicolinate reductase [Amaricoccus sp.]